MEISAGVHGGPVRDHAVRVRNVEVGIEGGGEPRSGIQRGEAVARLATDARERTGGVDRRTLDRDVNDRGVRGRVPAGGEPGPRIERRDAGPGLTADRREIASRIDQRTVHGQRQHLVVRARIPWRRLSGHAVERGDVVARLASDRRERATGIDDRAPLAASVMTETRGTGAGSHGNIWPVEASAAARPPGRGSFPAWLKLPAK